MKKPSHYYFSPDCGKTSRRPAPPRPPGPGARVRPGAEAPGLPRRRPQLSPAPGCSGIELLEADTFDLHCFQAETGTKFFATAPPGSPAVAQLLRRAYALYADYALKNPFYEPEMPIRCELFDRHLLQSVGG